MQKLLLLLLVTLAVLAANAAGLQLKPPDAPQVGSVSTSTIDDVAIVRNRFAESVLPAEPSQIAHLHALGEKYAASLQPNGSWPDVDYGDSALPYWPATDHLQRTLVMAKSARLYRDAAHPDDALETKVFLSLDWWTANDYQDRENRALWWWNEIGVPELIGESSTLMYAQLPPDQISKIVEIMKRSNWRKVPWTGANLTWGVINEIVRGCLENSPDTVAEGYDRMYREIKIVDPADEGIQQDDSFHQHGPQLYNGGYGLAYANDVGRFTSFAWGTHFQIPPDRMDIFSSYLLDGEQWLISGDVIDYSSIGREITRQGKVAVPQDWTVGPISPAGPAYSLGHVIAMLATYPSPRQKEFQEFAARMQAKAEAPQFSGNKQFWCSDFMAHRRIGFYTSVKMWSKRIVNGELTNGEGKESEHLSDGVNLLYLAGDEYKDIFPAWDWTKLPGTTAIQGTLKRIDVMGTRGTTTFTGGVSNGTYGMATMDLARDSLVAKKAWFFFDDSYVALGAGINLPGDSEHGVATDINQTRLAGNVFTNQSTDPLTSGVHTYTSRGAAWVYHNRVGYILGPDSRFVVSNGPQTGSWSDIGMGSNQPVTLPVFDLWIDHGDSPEGATYEYTLFPNATKYQVAERARLPTTHVLANSEAIQAVYNMKLRLVEAAFRKPGSLTTPLGRIQVDHSCLLIIGHSARGWKITASNPENAALILTVTLNGRQTTLPLPGANFAGSSVTEELKE
jgi:chondroitin AC lyase